MSPSRTSRIRLGTAVTVLSTQDPVHLFAEFSTLDAISSGRAQIAFGREVIPRVRELLRKEPGEHDRRQMLANDSGHPTSNPRKIAGGMAAEGM